MSRATRQQIENLKHRAAKAATHIPGFARHLPGVQDALSITTDLLQVVEGLAIRVQLLEEGRTE